jgi:hypothetical protein
MRWLVRHSRQPMPEEAELARFFERIATAFITCESLLHIEWAQTDARGRSRWRQEVINLQRTPKRLRGFAAQEHLAQLLLYGAARLDATDDLAELVRQMEADPMFFERVMSAALEKDIVDKKKRLLHDPGGRPEKHWRYYPIVRAAAQVFHGVTGNTLARSTSSATRTGSRASGQPIGPGIQFLKRLLAVVPERFSDESIAHLIRDA